MLTKKGKYGLQAMVHLAGLVPDELAQVADIADANSISKKFLDHILTELRHVGLVYSKKGEGGGYATQTPVWRMTYASARSCAPSMVLSLAFHALRSPRFEPATIAAIPTPVRSASSWSRPATPLPTCSIAARWPKCARAHRLII